MPQSKLPPSLPRSNQFLEGRNVVAQSSQSSSGPLENQIFVPSCLGNYNNEFRRIPLDHSTMKKPQKGLKKPSSSMSLTTTYLNKPNFGTSTSDDLKHPSAAASAAAAAYHQQQQPPPQPDILKSAVHFPSPSGHAGSACETAV
jgi:hypothetical protein